MNSSSRTKYITLNLLSGIGGQLVNNVLRFISRTAFIYILGKEYLGISSLFLNILNVLNLTELGFASAVSYSLYKPLANNDIKQVKAITNFLKRAYQAIGIIIIVIGVLITPILPYIMKGVTDVINIYLYYYLYLIQTAVSYLFFAYKGTLLIADQKKYLSDVASYFSQILINIFQIIILFFLKSFFLYTLLSIVGNIVMNFIISLIADKKYPFLKNNKEKLNKDEKKSIMKRVYAMSLYRISNTITNSTDNIIISTFLGVIYVGLYDNYLLIVNTVRQIVVTIFQSFTASIGNMLLKETPKRNEFIFRCINMLNFWITGVCSVCFILLFQPFIQLWIGNEYLLSFGTLSIIVINFATNYLQNAVLMFRDASGLFVQGKYRAVIYAVLNIVLSLLFVQPFGIVGVLVGTIISRMVTIWWFDAWLLYTKLFHGSPRNYYIRYLKACITIVAVSIITYIVVLPLSQLSWSYFFIKSLVVFIIPNIIYYFIYKKTDEMRYVSEKILANVKRKGS